MHDAHAPALRGIRGLGKPKDRLRVKKLAWLVEHRAQILVSIAVGALVVGGLLYAVAEGPAGQAVWRATVALLAAELAVEVGYTVVVEHGLGVDTIALVAMVGALALNQELAGLVIGLMFSGGASLEAIASRRARHELTALVQRAPKVALLHVEDRLQEVPVGLVRAGDTVLVRTGEVVPVDGTVLDAEAVIDTSTLTGEPLPETVRRGMPVLSGSANAGPRSMFAPVGPPARARTRRWSGWSSRRGHSVPRWYGWPTVMRGSFYRPRCLRPVSRGR